MGRKLGTAADRVLMIVATVIFVALEPFGAIIEGIAMAAVAISERKPAATVGDEPVAGPEGISGASISIKRPAEPLDNS
ncbi:hypothetical protein Ga0074812_101451 [Parafrankia irregularis]|uniref:Uncharacterized protein n=1 Tax=Parafrankia irregularis TaxID=795642 RepID=A0A0S4QF85_9ACTN|nr:hypothetical protein Ga0074812_101451 [Parafrankia irregularis]